MSTDALLVIEMQRDLVDPSRCEVRGLPGALARAVRDRDVLAAFARVIERCRARGAPVIYLTKERHPSVPWPSHAPIYRAARDPILAHGTPGAGVVDELAPTDDDIVIARYTSIDPSHGSTVWATLRSLGVTRLLMGGVSTTLAVEGMARAAANRGYEVVVLEDCCASVPDAWHDFSVQNVLPLIATVTSGADALSGA